MSILGLEHDHTLLHQTLTQRNVKSGKDIVEGDSFIICPTWSLYMSFLNYGSHASYIFDNFFGSFSLLTHKNLHTQKWTSINTPLLEVDTYCDL
jgi:hypothetical protein